MVKALQQYILNAALEFYLEKWNLLLFQIRGKRVLTLQRNRIRTIILTKRVPLGTN